MFDTPDITKLRELLNAYPVAMFVAQRGSPHHAFRILCINQEHERLSGVLNEEVEGMRPKDLLPADEGNSVEARYQFCVRTNRAIFYEETLHLTEKPAQWRTTLFPVKMPNTVQRLVGTAIQLEQGVAANQPNDAPLRRSRAVSGNNSVHIGSSYVSAAVIVLGASHFFNPFGPARKAPANERRVTDMGS